MSHNSNTGAGQTGQNAQGTDTDPNSVQKTQNMQSMQSMQSTHGEDPSAGPVTIESLKAEIERLSLLVRKNANAIVETGRHVLAIQVDQEKQALKSLKPMASSGSMRPSNGGVQRRVSVNSSSSTGASGLASPIKGPASPKALPGSTPGSAQSSMGDEPAGSSSSLPQGAATTGEPYLGARQLQKFDEIVAPSDDFDNEQTDQPLTSEDIVELVTELQGQLDMLDERSVRRTANAFVNADTDIIAPLPGRDGDLPRADEEMPFPLTLGDFKNLNDTQIEYWLRWYELLPPDEQELNAILARAGTTMEQMGLNSPQSANFEANANFDCLARFLGLRLRRVKNAW